MELQWSYNGAMTARPRKDKFERLSESMRLRMTRSDKKAFRAAAKKDNRDLSNWLRAIARREAGLTT